MFRSLNQRETIAWLIRTLDSGEPFAAVTGEPGVGKSAVAAMVGDLLVEGGYLVVRAAPPFGGPLELQRLLADALGLRAGPQTTPSAIAAALRDRSPSPGAPAAAVLVIDGAEHLPSTALQYLWLMRRLNGAGPPRLQVVFFGRFGFWERFAGPELDELRSEIVARFVVLPLPPDEALEYARHRLVLEGAPDPATVPRRLARRLVDLGQGNPARLNLVVRSVVGLNADKPQVTARGLRSAAVELEHGPTPARVAPRVGQRRRLAGLGGAAAVVLLGAGALLLTPRNASPLSMAVVQPASPPPGKPPAARPEVPARLVAPVALAVPFKPAPSPPRPDATPSLANAALLRVGVSYSAADATAQARANAVAARLRERGALVADPVATPGASRATTVEYFFLEDREQAEQVARELDGVATMGHGGATPEPPPPPGALRIVLSQPAATAAQ